MTRCGYLLGVVLLSVPGAAQEPVVIEVARLPSYTEAPVIDREGNLYVSEPFHKNISRITPEGEVSLWASPGNPNGHKILADGTHLVCDREHHAVLHMSATGEILGAAAEVCEGRPIREPNDLTLDPAGGFYFTDPGPFPEARDQDIGFICHVDVNGRTRVVADDLHFPNGIVLSPDGRRLLVSLGGGRDQILEFPVLEPGVVGEMTLFADRGSDGMALDTEGNLYTTGGGADGAHVDVLDRTGRQIRTYPIPFPFVSNLVFGGSDLNQLWVTGTSSQLNFSEPLVPQMRPQTGHYGLLLRLDLTGVRGVATLPSKH